MKEIDNNLESEVVDRFWILTVTGFGAHVLYRMEVNTTQQQEQEETRNNQITQILQLSFLCSLICKPMLIFFFGLNLSQKFHANMFL